MGSIVVVPGLWHTGLTIGVQGLSCSATYRIFLDQESNPCLLHWQADSLPLSHQGIPCICFLNHIFKKELQIRSSVMLALYFSFVTFTSVFFLFLMVLRYCLVFFHFYLKDWVWYLLQDRSTKSKRVWYLLQDRSTKSKLH